MSTNKITIAIIPVLLLGLFIFRGPHLTLSLSTAEGRGSAFDVPTCEPDALGNIDQTISLATGSSSAFDWAENVGCINRPIIDTWGVTQNPEEMGMYDEAQSIVQEMTPPAGATNLYRVTYTVHDIIDITWTLDWLHQIIQGTLSDPQNILITITKYSGSSLIQHFNGSIRLEKISPVVTRASTRLETKAPKINKDKLGQIINEVVNHLRTGTPFWDGISSTHVVDFE